MAVERATRNAIHRIAREAGDRIDERQSRRKLGPAPQTWAIARALRRRGGAEETAVVVVRYPSRAHGPAIDARRDYPDEKQSVEPWVTCIERTREYVGLSRHGGKYRRGHETKVQRGSGIVWPNSDA